METLTPEGPYGYTILPEVRADGSVGLPIITTHEGIQEAYSFIRGMSQLLSVTPLTEIRGAWYTFQDNLSRGRIKENGYEGPPHQTLALFPSGAGTGITGELVWIRVPRSRLGGDAVLADAEASGDTLSVALEREKVYQRHCEYLDALRRSDVEGVLSTLHDKAGIRSARLRQRDGHAHHAGGRRCPPCVLSGVLREVRRPCPSTCCLWSLRTGTSSPKFAHRQCSRRPVRFRLQHRRVPHAGGRWEVHRPHRARNRPGAPSAEPLVRSMSTVPVALRRPPS